MREICLLRSRLRGLETESRLGLHGHERGNPGYGQGQNLTDHSASPRPYQHTRQLQSGVTLGWGGAEPEVIFEPCNTACRRQGASVPLVSAPVSAPGSAALGSGRLGSATGITTG